MKVGLIAQGVIQKFINVTNDCSFSCKKRGENKATLKEKMHFPSHSALATTVNHEF